MVFCPEQALSESKIWTLLSETTSIPAPFIWESRPPSPGGKSANGERKGKWLQPFGDQTYDLIKDNVNTKGFSVEEIAGWRCYFQQELQARMENKVKKRDCNKIMVK